MLFTSRYSSCCDKNNNDLLRELSPLRNGKIHLKVPPPLYGTTLKTCTLGNIANLQPIRGGGVSNLYLQLEKPGSLPQLSATWKHNLSQQPTTATSHIHLQAQLLAGRELIVSLRELMVI